MSGFDRLTMSGFDGLTMSAHPEPFDSPLTLSRSKGERLAQDRPFDSPLTLSPAKDARLEHLRVALSEVEERRAQDDLFHTPRRASASRATATSSNGSTRSPIA